MRRPLQVSDGPIDYAAALEAMAGLRPEVGGFVHAQEVVVLPRIHCQQQQQQQQQNKKKNKVKVVVECLFASPARRDEASGALVYLTS